MIPDFPFDIRIRLAELEFCFVAVRPNIHTYGKKMARNGRTKDIYKGTFICMQTLGRCVYVRI